MLCWLLGSWCPGLEDLLFCLLISNLHFVSDGEFSQVSQLVLEDGLINWEGKARSFMEVGRSNDQRGGNKDCLQVNSLKHTQIINVFFL